MAVNQAPARPAELPIGLGRRLESVFLCVGGPGLSSRGSPRYRGREAMRIALIIFGVGFLLLGVWIFIVLGAAGGGGSRDD
jgi:hypothetical protein